MSEAHAGGQEPYPEPAAPPSAPSELPPIDTPQEQPPAAPFGDDGRTVDADLQYRAISAQSRDLTGGLIAA